MDTRQALQVANLACTATRVIEHLLDVDYPFVSARWPKLFDVYDTLGEVEREALELSTKLATQVTGTLDPLATGDADPGGD